MQRLIVESPADTTRAHEEFVTDWQLPIQEAAAGSASSNGRPGRNVVVQLMLACDVLVVRFPESHFSSAADAELQQLRSEVLDLSNQIGSSLIALDLSGVTFGASFLGMTVVLNQQLAAHGRRLCVIGDEHGLFRLTCLDQLIPTFADIDELERIDQP